MYNKLSFDNWVINCHFKEQPHKKELFPVIWKIEIYGTVLCYFTSKFNVTETKINKKRR